MLFPHKQHFHQKYEAHWQSCTKLSPHFRQNNRPRCRIGLKHSLRAKEKKLKNAILPHLQPSSWNWKPSASRSVLASDLTWTNPKTWIAEVLQTKVGGKFAALCALYSDEDTLASSLKVVLLSTAERSLGYRRRRFKFGLQTRFWICATKDGSWNNRSTQALEQD